jgi:hypothetical protein
MDSYEISSVADHWSIDPHSEMESKLKSLRALVCDLLKTNQELRTALLEARAGRHTIKKTSQ